MTVNGINSKEKIQSCTPEVTDIIKKWYSKLDFDPKYDDEFYKALDVIAISPDTCIESYNLESEDGKKNLLSFLYMCEALATGYAEMGIGDDILLDTLADIVRWTNTWSDLKGELYLGELFWLSHHMKMKLFKIGRLQYFMDVSPKKIASFNVNEGDNVLGIHIPAAGALRQDKCIASLDMAREFFAKYYPDFAYKCFTCHSWLLGTNLRDILPPGSNILAFQQMFDIVESDESDAALKYVFKWNTTRANVADVVCTSSLASKIKEMAMEGKKFYCGLGIIKK